MRTWLKSALARAYAAGGGLRRQHAGRLVVLTFHRVRPDGEIAQARSMRNLEVPVSDFRRLLVAMRARYEPVALRDWMVRAQPPPRGAFAITFDDGWADNFHHAWPVLRELNLPATLFLATGAVEDRTAFWWQNPALTDHEIERLKHQPAARPVPPVAGMADKRVAGTGDFLTWNQVRDMGCSGLVHFGPHGHRHELMTLLSREEALADIRRCWQLLQEHVPEAVVPLLSWPNGDAREDLAPDLAALGLQAAFGTRRGVMSVRDPVRWNLPRNNVDRNMACHPELLPWLLMRAR